MKLADNLKIIRRDNNLSQEQLAEKLGVSRQAVSKWESGQSYPEMDKVLLICKLFNYNIDELMNENVKEVEENKQAKSNVNKYVEDFFGFITKTIDMFSSMKFRQRLKCIFEQCVIACILVALFVVIGFVGSEILLNLFGTFGEEFYYGIRGIFEAVYLVFALISGTTILLHIFKTRYLDYYEIVKEDGEQETKIDEESKKEETENYNEKHKVFIEKKKEKIIIRDPNHSNSKFLTGLFRILLAFIKIMVLGVGVAFTITFVCLFMILVLSFMFVKTGVLFMGAALLVLALALGNFVILELLYNFVTNKKTNKTRIGIMLLVALIVTGISIGFILIGITDFKVVEDNSSSFEVEEVYEYEMTDNLSLYSYNCAYRYVETDTDNVKVVARHTKYTETSIYNENDVIDIYCDVNDIKTIELIKQIIVDLNNKELRDYPNCAEVYIYASRENIDKIQKNNMETHRYNQEYIIESYMNECENLRNKVYNLEEDIIRYKEEIDNLNDTIREYQMSE